MNAADSILSVEGLKVARGGAQVLDIPSFSLREKEIVTVIGPNGSGKSTLLLSLAGLIQPAAGRLTFRGEPLGTQDQRFRYRRKISMVFQDPLLFDTTVYNNVAAGLKFRGLAKNDVEQGVKKYLDYFQCAHLAGRSARKLSGGESQRISLARAFAIEPEILFLDEPFSSLDPPTRHSLIRDLNRIIRETQTATVMVTHVESEALNMSDCIAVMDEGSIIQTGAAQDVMQQPANVFAAKFAGMESIVKGRIIACHGASLVISAAERKIHAIGNGQPEEEVACCLRPEQIALRLPMEKETDAPANTYHGRITDVYRMGPLLKIGIDCGFPLTAIILQETFAGMGLAEGNRIQVSFQPESVYIIHGPGGRGACSL